MKKITFILIMVMGFITMNAQTFYEDFNNGIPSTFQIIDVDGLTPNANVAYVNDAWVSQQRSGSDKMATSTSWYSPAGTSNDWLITPKLTPATGDFLVWEAKAVDPNYKDGYLVKISTTDSAMASFTTTLSTVAAENSSWTSHNVDLSSYVGQNIYIAFINNSNDKFILNLDNIGLFSDQYNVKPRDFSIPSIVMVNTAVDIKANVLNLGLTSATSYEVSYSINGGTAVTSTIAASPAIAIFGSDDFTHPTNWTPTAAGTYTLKYWVGNINGTNANINTDTITTTIAVATASQGVQRTPLYETFTSSTCGPCVAGNTNMDALFAANANKWSCVKYQMSWPGSGDAYYTAEGGVRRTFYQVNSVPNQQIDGGYDGNSSSVTQGDFDAAYAIPAYMNITANLTVVGHTATLDYSIDPKLSLSAGLVVHVAIVEEYTTKNTGSNGETSFNWVMKKMMPDASGTSLSALTANTTVSNTLVHEFKGSYRLPANAGSPINHATEHSIEDFSKLVAVVWVQDMNNRDIFQSVISSVTLGMDNAQRENLIKNIYPNPATDVVNVDLNLNDGENVEISIINNIGQVLSVKNYGKLIGNQNIQLDVSNLATGIYHIKVKMDDKIFTKPLNVR